MQPHQQLEPAEPRSLWQHRNFMRLWIALVISAIGDQFTALAVPLTAVLLLDATPSQMGYLVALQTASFLLISLFAGVWVDRLPRRRIIIITDLGRAAVLLAIPLLAYFDALRMWHLYVIMGVAGIQTVFSSLSEQAYLPLLIGRRQVVQGNSRLEAAWSVSGMVGPSLAGVVIHWLSAPVAILVDALSFILSAGLISTIRDEREQPQEARKLNTADGIRHGFRIVFGSPVLRALAAAVGSTNFCSSALTAVYILYATQVLALTPASLGLAMGIGSVGGLVGATLAEPAARRIGVGRCIVWGLFTAAVAQNILPLATPATAFAALTAAILIRNLVGPIFNINQVSLRQAITPHAVQGRMNATMRFLNTGPSPLGGLCGGFLAEAVGLRGAVAIIAVGYSLCFLWVYFSPVRNLRDFPAPLE